MLFSIKLTYVRPVEEINAHLDDHKRWLVKYIKAGNILFAGPLLQGHGGYIVGYADQLAEIQAMLAEDPFELHQLASFDIQSCEPAIRAGDFPARWAADARAV